MKRGRNLLTALLLTLAMMVSLMPCAGAANVVNPDTDKGSVEVTLKSKGMEATLYRVGIGKVENSNLLFELQSELKAELGDLELNSLKAAEVEAVVKELTGVKDLEKVLGKNEVWVVTATQEVINPESGSVVGYSGKQEDLAVGVYLVVQTKNFSGYEDFDPFLLYLPANEDGSWESSVTANPKAEYETGGGGGGGEEIPDPPPPKDPGDPPDDPGDPPEEIPEEEVPLATLPQTGLLQWPVPVMAMAGLVLFAVGFASEKRRKAQME